MTRSGWTFAALIVAVAVAFAVSLLIGRVWIDPRVVVHELSLPGPHLGALIFTDLRLPRAVLACIVGASLGVSGAVLQGLTRNPLAEPGLLGVTAGAALGAVIAIYFGMSNVFEVAGPIMGLIGGLGASSLTFALARGGGITTLILAGAAVSGFAGAGISIALNLAPNPYAAYEIMTWLMGSLTDRSWSHVLLVLPFVVAGLAMLAFTGRALDALAIGEAQAESLGIDLGRTRILSILGTALAVGATTSVTGSIGFIGLIAPHLVRPFVSYQPRRILLPAAFVGALLVLCADILTRVISVGPEIKLGVFTTLLGTPFFFWLVLRLRKTAP
jgi:iron complex transport system permease protein